MAYQPEAPAMEYSCPSALTRAATVRERSMDNSSPRCQSLNRITVIGKNNRVEQARATVRLRSQERRSMVSGVSSAPKAACADEPWTCASLTHPTRITRPSYDVLSLNRGPVLV